MTNPRNSTNSSAVSRPTRGTMSAAEAAVVADVDKASIIRAIQAGKISARKNRFGDWRITPKQLRRYRRRNEQPQSEFEERLIRVSRLLVQAMNEIEAMKKSRARAATDGFEMER